MRTTVGPSRRIPTIITSCLAGALLLLPACDRSQIESTNQDAVALCKEGTADLQSFRFDDAVEKLGHCLELDPSLAEAGISRALAFANLRDHKRYAEELARADSLTAAISDDRRRMLAQLRLGRLSSSRFNSMGDSLRDRMARQEPDNLYVLEALAEHAEITGKVDKAVAIWLRLLDANPNYTAVYNKLGYLELGRGNYDDGLDYLQKYIFLAPDLANPHDSYGEGLMTRGQYEEAEQEFRTAIRMEPTFYPSLVNLGRSYLARGKVAKGTAIFDKVQQRIAGTDAERTVSREILMSYLATDQRDELSKMSRKYVANYPEAALTPLLRCQILSRKGHFEQGVGIMDSTLVARRANPHYRQSPAAHIATELFASQHNGFKHDHLGESAAAAAAWARTVRLLTDNTPFYQQFFPRTRLAASRLAAGQPDSALLELDAMLVVNPRLFKVLTLKVRSHLALGHTEQAAAALAQLQWALEGADADFGPRLEAVELGTLVDNLAQR